MTLAVISHMTEKEKIRIYLCVKFNSSLFIYFLFIYLFFSVYYNSLLGGGGGGGTLPRGRCKVSMALCTSFNLFIVANVDCNHGHLVIHHTKISTYHILL